MIEMPSSGDWSVASERRKSMEGKMRKGKTIRMLTVIIMMIMVSACANEKDKKGENSEKVQETTNIQKETAGDKLQEVTQETVGKLTEDKIRQLVHEGIYCTQNVFELSYLPRESDGIDYNGRKLYQVDQTVFEDFAAFEEYVRSVYCKETADLYLYKVPYEEKPIYVNVDGKLYVDIDSEGGKGYYVDWSEYTIEIHKQTETRCEITVIGSVEWPSSNPVKEPYPVEEAIVLEDGRWVLEKMIY